MDPQERTQALVDRARAGDRAAFEELFGEHRSRLEALVRHRLGTGLRRRLDVEDVLQETLLRALGSVQRFRWQNEDSFFLWMSGIAVNVLREAVGEEKRRPMVPLEFEIPGEDISPSHAERREERFDRLARALDSLSPEHRKVILLARLDRLPVKEIARQMGHSPAAVSQLLMRALQKLRDSFGDTDSLHLPHRSLSEGRDGDERR